MPESRAAQVFAHNLRVLLEEREISISTLAEELGSLALRPGLSRVLAGKEGVTLDRAERIAAYFGFPLSALIAEKIKIRQPA